VAEDADVLLGELPKLDRSIRMSVSVRWQGADDHRGHGPRAAALAGGQHDAASTVSHPAGPAVLNASAAPVASMPTTEVSYGYSREITVDAICRRSRSFGVLIAESLSTPVPIVASYPQNAI